ncbi:MAG: hypothetical protein KF681_07540 [Bdellovibrionaceae bacterium]|nr:hypothetical protein [Pseudobdellovibrionaceae bacterium]
MIETGTKVHLDVPGKFIVYLSLNEKEVMSILLKDYIKSTKDTLSRGI